MTIGSPADMLGRLKAVLPGGWFPVPSLSSGTGGRALTTESGLTITTESGLTILTDGAPASTVSATPVLDVLLTGISWMWSWLYGLVQYARAQTRLATTTDVFLDGFAVDYFGTRIQRNNGEGDTAFRLRLQANLLPLGNTKAALIRALTLLTGQAPTIVQPWSTGDCGSVNAGVAPNIAWGGLAVGVVGVVGSYQMPFQAFATVHQGAQHGIPNVMGVYYGSGWAGGGVGVGSLEVLSQAQLGAVISATAIYQTIANTQPEGSIIWTDIVP